MNLEDDLRRALKRTPAPDDFADRIIGRVERGELPKAAVIPFARPRMRVVQWLAAAAAVTLMTAGGANYYRQRQAIAEAERAQAEVMLALQITSEAFAVVQDKLQNVDR